MTKYFLCIILAACGSEPELSQWTDRFEREAALHGLEVVASPMVFGDYKKAVLAVCSDGIIYVKESAWRSMNDEARWLLTLHEQGHCAFGMKHTAGTVMQGVFEGSLSREMESQYWSMAKETK